MPVADPTTATRSLERSSGTTKTSHAPVSSTLGNMADNHLSPVVTRAVEYDHCPVTEPPQTEFPYPESKKISPGSSRKRIDSETTLTEDRKPLTPPTTKYDHGLQRSATAGEALPLRPSLSASKYDTDFTKPVGGRPFLGRLNRHSTTSKARVDPSRWASKPRKEPDTSDTSSSDEDGYISAVEEIPLPHRALSRRKTNSVRRPRPDQVSFGNEHFRTKGKLAKDGRLNVTLNETSNNGYLAKALGVTLQSHLAPHAPHEAPEEEDTRQHFAQYEDGKSIPRLNIVIMVIGSRGDIQPFLKIGKILQDKYGHRVRIATHPTFRKFVQDDIGLEFFSIGGDPSELMAFMVKNPGLIPTFETVKAGEIGRRREQMFEMFQGFWRACINATDDEKDTTNLKMLGDKHPFVADAIIANPPSFAHFHCAERLGIPLHLVFTFPYTPTVAFPHPLANIKSSNVEREYANLMSYPLVDLMTWQGLGDLVNRFRVKTLGLDPLSTLWAPGQAARLRVPMTYLWSPGLVPKPADWGPHIDIAGYVFLDLGSSFKPPEDLSNFLQRSNDDRPIVYIGFGSISGLDDPTAFCMMIFEAVEKANVRAIISRGWGGMGDGLDKPDGVFLIDNVPHDWLFPQVDAVIHHGGAGTTAAGLKFGKPTMIVPFFGDQPFWAAMIARAGAGAKQALPLKQLDSEKFAEGILQCLEPEAKEKAQEIAQSIIAEGDGAENAVDSFHRSLLLNGKHSMRCGIFEDRVAVWKVKHTGLQLSALAAELLVENRQVSWSDLQLVRHKEWTDFSGPGEPITGVGSAIVSSFQEAFHGISSISEMTKRDMKRIERRKRKNKTVADAISMPAAVAQTATTPGAVDTYEDVSGPVNLHGQAEPPKHPTLDGRDHYDASRPERPYNLRTTTAGTIQTLYTPTPVVIARDVGKGVGHSAKAIFHMPWEILNAITLGLRNAPRLYGDQTVRAPPHAVTGFRSGVLVAGKELWFGFYDGFSGVILIPHHGVQEEGFPGLPKGIARGVGGLVLKPLAGVLAVPTFVSKGVRQSLRRRVRDTQRTERWLRRARMTQGDKDARTARHEKANLSSNKHGMIIPQANDMDDLRSVVLSRWTTRERELVEHARVQDQQKLPDVFRASRVRTA